MNVQNKKWVSYLYRTATTVYPCFLPDLGEFNRSWSYKTYPTQRYETAGFFPTLTILFYEKTDIFADKSTKPDKMEENKQPSLLKSTMNYGAMLGIILIIYTLLTWMLDIMNNEYLRYITFIIVIAGIVLATKTFRDQEQGGAITYGRALGVGTLTVIFAGVIVSFFTYILYAVIDPGLIEKTYLLMEEQYYDAGMTDAQIETAMSMAKRFSNPVMMSVFGLIGYAIMGLIFSLITSIFLKKEGDPFGV